MNTPEPINKPLVGIIGLVCLISAGVCWVFFPDQSSALSACVRVGVVMTALYFALPKPGEQVRWGRLIPVIAGSIVVIALAKKMILVILPMLIILGILLALLRPRAKQRPPRER